MVMANIWYLYGQYQDLGFVISTPGAIIYREAPKSNFRKTCKHAKHGALPCSTVRNAQPSCVKPPASDSQIEQSKPTHTLIFFGLCKLYQQMIECIDQHPPLPLAL